jgi:hypothetical protein
MKWLFLAALGLACMAAPATAADLKIVDVRASLFWERAGKFSEIAVGAQPLENLAKGGGADHDTATAVLFDLTFSGDKNASPKYATATVDITQSSRAGQQIVTRKAFTNFIFGAEGVEHKAFLLENSTCMPITVDVRAGKTTKNVRLDFQCAGS